MGPWIKRFLLGWLIGTILLSLLSYLLPTILVSSFSVAVIVAFILVLIDTLLRPTYDWLRQCEWGHTPFSPYLDIFSIRILLFLLVACFFPGFHVSGFLTALICATVFSVFMWLLSLLFIEEKNNGS
ncbi:MAG: phage holin family protein [Burkholderiales bacterium]|jgi:putative membrane protein|nr:phage holin family protein [Burkholderiales bacterium]